MAIVVKHVAGDTAKGLTRLTEDFQVFQVFLALFPPVLHDDLEIFWLKVEAGHQLVGLQQSVMCEQTVFTHRLETFHTQFLCTRDLSSLFANRTFWCFV